MTGKPLTPELITLVQHIELNKAGWWDRSMQQLILSVLWLSARDLTEIEIDNYLKETFHLEAERSRLRSQCEALAKQGVLIPLPSRQYRLSQAAKGKLEQEIKEGEANTQKAKERFLALLNKQCPSLDPERTWGDFQTKLLVPLVREIGARTYELISGSNLDLDATAQFPEFLSVYDVKHHQDIRTVIVNFLDPTDNDIRPYILRHLNAYFSIEAGRLPEGIIEALSHSLKKPPAFKIFVDTNFLFSFLELHDNPSNEAAKSLVELTRQIKGRAPCKFYVSPETLDEFKRVVNAQKDFLSGLVLPPNLAHAALEMDLSSVAQRFIAFNQNNRQPVTAESYFAPYLYDLIPTLRSKEVEFFNEAMAGYSTRQDVVDDILEQQRFESTKYGDNAKSYSQLRHDVTLWHFCNDKRPVRVESPIDAEFWIVTVDYHFLGFDLHKRGGTQASIPICLHPASLIQLLQFWLPRTPQFEEAILDSLRLPLMFQEFDPSAESVTVRILSALARFDNADQLNVQTIGSILVNQALRQKISSQHDVQKQIELVHGALIEENQKAIEYAKATEAEKAQLTVQIEERDSQIDTLKLQAQLNAEQIRHLNEQIQKSAAGISPVPLPVTSTPATPPPVSISTERFYFSIALGTILVLLLMGLFLAAHRQSGHDSASRVLRIGCSIVFIVWVLVVNWAGSRTESVRTWRVFHRFQQFKIWFIGLLAFLTGWNIFEPVLGDIADWFKSFLK
ncbi:MAG TPA: hypothetical protein VEI54_07300 [Candidatus Limnocylindrales bacterium]|nr:hypothetical protein [Candidatus Limnocylindrales bacterium]